MSGLKAWLRRRGFFGGLALAALLALLDVADVSAQPRLVGSAVHVQLFYPDLETVFYDYGSPVVVSGTTELSGFGVPFCANQPTEAGTCSINIEASSIDVSFTQDRSPFGAAFNGWVFTLPFVVNGATLTPVRAGGPTVSFAGNVVRIDFGGGGSGTVVNAGDTFHIALDLANDRLDETFTGATTTAAVYGLPGGGFPCLTAGNNSETTPVPGCSSDNPDTPGSGALRLTDALPSQVAGLFYSNTVPTTEGLVVTFKQYQYGGDGADGIAFVLAVAPPATLGAAGGSLGYTSGAFGSAPGLPGGWLGIGFDAFGNFANALNRSSQEFDPCPAQPFASPNTAYPNEVTARGPGNGTAGYCLISSSLEAGESDPLGFYGFQLRGADRASSLRAVKIVIDPVAGTYSVGIDPAGGTNYVSVTTGPLPSFYFDPAAPSGGPIAGRPPRITFGWTAATGQLFDIHEISDVRVTTLYPPTTGGTTTFAQSVPDVTVPATGSSSVPLGNIEIDENAPGVLTGGGTISVTAPAGLKFVSVSVAGRNGLAELIGPASIDSTGRTVSFDITAPSAGSPGKIVASGIFVSVTNPSASFCGEGIGFSGSGNPVCVNVSGSAGSGLTSVSNLQVANFAVLAATDPAVTAVSVSAVGTGVSRNITITGANFAAGDTVSFVCHAPPCGPGISVVPGSTVVGGDGKSISLDIQVAANAQTGLYDVVVTRGGQQFTAGGKLVVNPAPTVTSAGTEDGTQPLLSPPAATPPGVNVLKGQTVFVRGTGFLPPTTVPSDLKVSVSGTGITVTRVAFDSDTQLAVEIDVAQGAESVSPRMVTVVNPDLGTTTSAAVLAIEIAPPTAPVGQSPTATSGTTTAPPAPQVSKISPLSGPTGFAPVTISGKNFSATPANNLVTFTRANNLRAVATITSASTSTLKVVVPADAVDGPITVATSGVQQSTTPINFTVTNPTVTSAQVAGGPAGAKRGGPAVTVDLFGTKFASSGVTVAFTPSTSLTVGTVRIIDSTHLTVTVTASSSAALGLRDITVTNPDGASSTLPQSFAVNGQFDLALSLTNVDGSPISLAAFPSVSSVQVTLDAAGKCTARVITPTLYLLTARFPSTQPTTLPNLTFTLTSSARPGTATNDDCEPNLALVPALPAEPDFSIAPVGAAPNVAVQQLTVSPVNGAYPAVVLASWDRGGTVSITVANSTGTAGTIGTALNLNRVNGVLDSTTKRAADGLTDFEKQRGVYLVAPAKGTTGELVSHVRLDASARNLFVRGRGFSTDPTLPAGSCGFNSITGAAIPASVTQPMPCPRFKVGDAFQKSGVNVWDVTGSFNAAGTLVFPTKSFADPTKPMLDLATVTYDAANCSGGAACDHTSKLGPRQSGFPTLGFSTFGTASTYGTALVLGTPFKAYFLDRPYLHQENIAGKFLPVPTSGPTAGRPMLAPITVVCDQSSGGQDDGAVQSGECAVNAVPGGDTYRAGQFTLNMTVMDVNNDGCVELPFVGDPRTLTPCNQSTALPTLDDSATAPQATFQQVVTRIITHELGHAVGINVHTSVATDLMYMYSINWTRDDFSSQAAALIQIHNRGQQ